MTSPDLPQLHAHCLKLALLQPQIAPNTGNIARACVATGSQLHLVRPLGFVLSDKNLRRSAMDYWPQLRLTIHDDTNAFFDHASRAGGSLWLVSTTGALSLWDVKFADNDWLIFGSETAGIPDSVLSAHPSRVLRIPQAPHQRCLNLSSAAAIGLFEALRQLHSGTMPGFAKGQSHESD
jgi:tRNA (cytidine/uridine-2'-O-)-methyltransferase